MSENKNTFYLFAEPSFIEGVASVLDLGSTIQNYNEHLTEKDADASAIRRDWSSVGNDITNSIKIYEQEEQKMEEPVSVCK